MKTNQWVFTTVAVCLVAIAGCKKAEPAEGPPQEYYGVKVDLPKLDATFANASPDVLDSVAQAKHGFRYELFPQALAALDKLSKHPALTEPQKKLVSDLIEQTKQVIAKAPPPPGR